MSDTKDKQSSALNQTNTAQYIPDRPPEAGADDQAAQSALKEYVYRVSAFEFFYSQILTGVAIIVAIGIAVAVLYSVIIGAAVTVSAALFYKFTVDDKLKKLLGLKYKIAVGGLSITYCRPVYKGEIRIPKRLMWYDVIGIEAGALQKSKKHVPSRIFLPRTLTSISPDALEGCNTLKEIYFEGSEAQWQSVKGADKLEGYSLVFDAKYPAVRKKKKKSAPKKSVKTK